MTDIEGFEREKLFFSQPLGDRHWDTAAHDVTRHGVYRFRARVSCEMSEMMRGNNSMSCGDKNVASEHF